MVVWDWLFGGWILFWCPMYFVTVVAFMSTVEMIHLFLKCRINFAANILYSLTPPQSAKRQRFLCPIALTDNPSSKVLTITLSPLGLGDRLVRRRVPGGPCGRFIAPCSPIWIEKVSLTVRHPFEHRHCRRHCSGSSSSSSVYLSSKGIKISSFCKRRAGFKKKNCKEIKLIHYFVAP